jgi:hypothetical protein
VSARGATHGAAHARQVDVPARDEEDATTGHAPMVSHRRDELGVTQATGPSSIAVRIRVTDSASGVIEVSITRSGRCGGS